MHNPCSIMSFIPAGSDSTSSDSGAITHWLMKSEPESRLENGIDMKFGLEDLKAEPDQVCLLLKNYFT